MGTLLTNPPAEDWIKRMDEEEAPARDAGAFL